MVSRFFAAFALAGALLSGSPARAGTDDQGRTTHTVYAGQTLAKIAKRYRVSVDSLCRINGLRHGARIQPGQELVIPTPGEEDAPPAPRVPSNRWQDYTGKPRKKGFVVLDAPTKHWRGFVLTPRGKILPKANDAILRMFASWRTGAEHDVDIRLVQLIVRVSNTFAGRPLRVVSGYRENSFFQESKHKVGRAFDFSIPGVPNGVVRDYLRTLPNVGVGYYPNATHVHLDVREESAYWMDLAGPGEPPRGPHPPDRASPPPEETAADEVETVKGDSTETRPAPSDAKTLPN